LSDSVEEDKNSYEDLEEITAEIFDEVSRNSGDLFLSVGDNNDGNNIVVDDKIDEENDEKKLMRMMRRLVFLKQ